MVHTVNAVYGVAWCRGVVDQCIIDTRRRFIVRAERKAATDTPQYNNAFEGRKKGFVYFRVCVYVCIVLPLPLR